ncbi:MAG: sigma-70 family RNA polymerase sigma factor [Candidatus Hydrogenedentes bacterium]|nr:sigma-70 family RNA polymerase sigma factor [Candidatus Hydrogenedentota bacterium]
MAYNDWTLLERWTHERDAEAFAEVARRYASVVYGACRRVLGDAAEAEDAAQECFLTLAQTRKPPRTNLGAWLHRVAANKARDRVKAASRRRDRERRYMDHQPGAAEIAWPEIESLVDDAIAALPEDTRDALVAHFMLGESHAAIAERLGVSRQTVTYRVGKGVDGIREALRVKGIQVGATALTASLTAHMAEAAPAQLIAVVGKMAVSGVPAAAGGALTSAIVSKAAFVGVPLLVLVLGIVAFNQFDSSIGVEDPPTANTATVTSIVVEPAPIGAEAAQIKPDASREPRAENTRPDGPILSGAARDVSGAGRFEVRSSESGAELEPIDIQLPEPCFGSTPMDYFSELLEERSYKPRPPFLAPKGTTNLAKGKTVTSSDPDPNHGELAFLTDGKKGYQEDYLVELASGAQWAQIDLGQISQIYAIVVWHFHAADRVYFDVAVRVADDAEFTKNVQTVFNNDHDNSLGLGVGKDKEYIETYEGRLMDAKGIKGRYVRLYSNGNTTDETNHYVEVEVYGKPATSAFVEPVQEQAPASQPQ